MSTQIAILKITDRSQADELIRDIRRAVRNSARTGGGYGVYRRGPAGDYAVAIEVNIKPVIPPRRAATERKASLWTSLSSC